RPRFFPSTARTPRCRRRFRRSLRHSARSGTSPAKSARHYGSHSGGASRVSQSEYNQLSVRLELQADFLAGVWARYADRIKHVVEAGDIEEAMRAASAVGDDRLQYRSRGYVVPDSFTHGTSEQRVRWFRRGYETGDV